MQRLWSRCIMRVDFINLKADQPVYVKPTGLRHRASLGVTYWVYSSRSKNLYQVSDSAYGPNLGQLVTYHGKVELQQELNFEASLARANGQYGLKRLKQIKELMVRTRG